MKYLAALLLIFPLLAHAVTIIDGSTPEKMKASFTKMGSELSKDQAELLLSSFDAVLQRGQVFIMMKVFQGEVDENDQKAGEKLAFQYLSSKLSGKTAKEIIMIGRSFVEDEITGIERSAFKAIVSEKKLKSIKINRISHKIEGKNIRGMPKVLVNVEVTNNTKQAISTIYFMCSLKSPGRKTPWLQEKIVHEIPGGIEPGETLQWEIEPNVFEWDDTTVIADDSKISAVIYQVNDAYKQPLWSVNNDSLGELSKLKVLQEKSEEYVKVVGELN